MAHLLRFFNVLIYLFLWITLLHGKGFLAIPYSHIIMALMCFLFILFVQAFTMFFFIGVSRMVTNARDVFSNPTLRQEYIDPQSMPEDLEPYEKKIKNLTHEAILYKRKNIPWCILIQILCIITLFLGGAHDTQIVSREVHFGAGLGLLFAFTLGLIQQWRSLGKVHLILRKIKELFQIPESTM